MGRWPEPGFACRAPRAHITSSLAPAHLPPSPRLAPAPAQPFQLASLERHAMCSEKAALDREAAIMAEEQAHSFKASSFNKTMVSAQQPTPLQPCACNHLPPCHPLCTQ
jgi:hypothetical protein